MEIQKFLPVFCWGIVGDKYEDLEEKERTEHNVHLINVCDRKNGGVFHNDREGTCVQRGKEFTFSD